MQYRSLSMSPLLRYFVSSLEYYSYHWHRRIWHGPTYWRTSLSRSDWLVYRWWHHYAKPYTLRKIAANGGNPVPEERLIPTMMGSVLFPIGLFWLGWTGNYPHAIPWIVPTLAGSFVGGGIILIFLSSVTYIVESYLMIAASAMYHCSVRIRSRIRYLRELRSTI
jgi:hypothetical protein